MWANTRFASSVLKVWSKAGIGPFPFITIWIVGASGSTLP